MGWIDRVRCMQKMLGPWNSWEKKTNFLNTGPGLINVPQKTLKAHSKQICSGQKTQRNPSRRQKRKLAQWHPWINEKLTSTSDALFCSLLIEMKMKVRVHELCLRYRMKIHVRELCFRYKMKILVPALLIEMKIKMLWNSDEACGMSLVTKSEEWLGELIEEFS